MLKCENCGASFCDKAGDVIVLKKDSFKRGIFNTTCIKCGSPVRVGNIGHPKTLTLEERKVEALESIAKSLERMSTPIYKLGEVDVQESTKERIEER